MAKTVREIEQAIAQLTKDQLAEFRAWYEKFDSDVWDRQIEEDIATGKLDALADAAIADHRAGRTKKLRITLQAHRFGRPMNRFLPLFRIWLIKIMKFLKSTPATHHYI